MASEFQVDFLGRVPIDPKLTESHETGVDFINAFKESSTASLFASIAKRLTNVVQATTDAPGAS